MNLRLLLACGVTAASLIGTAVPASATTTPRVEVITVANDSGTLRAITVDDRTGRLYVGRQDSFHGATVDVYDAKHRRRDSVRVGEAFDPADNPPDDGENYPTYVPSNVIAVTINQRTRTLLTLVSSTLLTTSGTYSGLNGAYVVAVDMRTNKVTKRYEVAQFSPPAEGARPSSPTLWTGFAVDERTNTLWGVEGFDPTESNGVERLDLTTGKQTHASIPVVAADAPIDAVPTIAFNEVAGRAYVSVAGVVFGISRSLNIVTTLAVPERETSCAELPGTGPTATASAVLSNRVYMTYCSHLYIINGMTGNVVASVSTGFNVGLVVDSFSRSVYSYETRSGLTGLAVRDAVTGQAKTFIPLRAQPSAGNGWIDNDPVRKQTYLVSGDQTVTVASHYRTR